MSEVLLWKELKGKKLENYRFIRQKPIKKYIVDFYSKELKLAIEIDGVTHDFEEEKNKKDIERQKEIESLGINFLRFSEGEIRKNMFGVIETIRTWILNR